MGWKISSKVYLANISRLVGNFLDFVCKYFKVGLKNVCGSVWKDFNIGWKYLAAKNVKAGQQISWGWLGTEIDENKNWIRLKLLITFDKIRKDKSIRWRWRVRRCWRVMKSGEGICSFLSMFLKNYSQFCKNNSQVRKHNPQVCKNNSQVCKKR